MGKIKAGSEATAINKSGVILLPVAKALLASDALSTHAHCARPILRGANAEI